MRHQQPFQSYRRQSAAQAEAGRWGREKNKMKLTIILASKVIGAMLLIGTSVDSVSAQTEVSSVNIRSHFLYERTFSVSQTDPEQTKLGIRLISVSTNHVIVQNLKSGEQKRLRLEKTGSTLWSSVLQTEQADALLKSVEPAKGSATFEVSYSTIEGGERFSRSNGYFEVSTCGITPVAFPFFGTTNGVNSEINISTNSFDRSKDGSKK